MLKKLYLALIWSFSIVTMLSAQNFDDYQLLKGTGNIPQEFLTPSSVKYEKELATIDEDEKKQQQKDKAKFFLESNFLIDDLLQSGKVLFNDPVTQYINKVADQLLVNEPELRKQIRFYAVSSPAVNAFATNQGIIFVNIGLIAQLETEAQLAFILAHEISHVRHKHALDMYLEARQIDRGMSSSQVMKQTSFDDKLIAKNYFSKELETEADKKGLQLYLNSKYSLKELGGVFDVLQYSYLPFELKTFDKSFLESAHFEIPENYVLPDSAKNEIGSLEEKFKAENESCEEEDDSKSTHPSVDKRRVLAATTVEAAKLDAKAMKGRKSYLVDSKEHFLKIRDIARFELCYYYLDQYRYQDAIYAVYLLSEKYPNSKYLKKIMAKSLYGYAKFKNEIANVKTGIEYYIDDEDIGLWTMRSDAYQAIEGDLQAVYYTLSKLKANETNILALRYVWDVFALYPADTELKQMQEDLLLELVYQYESLDSFSTTTLEEDIAALEKSLAALEEKTAEEKQDTANTDTLNTENLSKYAKIKAIKEKSKEETTPDAVKEKEMSFAEYAFVDILDSDQFKKAFEAALEEKKRIDNNIDFYNSHQGREALKKERRTGATALGIDSVLVLFPYYLKVVQSGPFYRKENKIKYLYSEKRQSLITDLLLKNAAIAGVETSLIDPTQMQPTDTDKFNDMRMLNEWLSQQSRLGSSVAMLGFNQSAIDKIIKKYNKRYILFSGIISMKYKKNNWMLYTMLYDLQTGRYKIIKEDYYAKRTDNKTLLNAHLFDTFFQIKSRRK